MHSGSSHCLQPRSVQINCSNLYQTFKSIHKSFQIYIPLNIYIRSAHSASHETAQTSRRSSRLLCCEIFGKCRRSSACVLGPIVRESRILSNFHRFQLPQAEKIPPKIVHVTHIAVERQSQLVVSATHFPQVVSCRVRQNACCTWHSE
jgi:hypothetical protein